MTIEHDRSSVTFGGIWEGTSQSVFNVNVLPHLGRVRLEELTSFDLAALQRTLKESGLKPATIDGVIHSALRALLRDARSAGYAVPDLRALFDRQELQRVDQGDMREIVVYSEAERADIETAVGRPPDGDESRDDR